MQNAKNYAVVVEHYAQGGTCAATSPNFPNVVGIGATARQAVERFRAGLVTYLAHLAQTGQDAPEPCHSVETIVAQRDEGR
jgi:hypothetical protein